MSRRARVVCALLVAGSVAAAPGIGAERLGGSGGRQQACLDDEIRKQRGLLCPDLEMRPPYDLARARLQGGTPVLQAANSIDSVGDGPAELRGKRNGRLSMAARQRVYERGGGRTGFDTGAKLAFKRIPGQGRYWKFRDAARFELWRLDEDGDRMGRIEVGPKQIYCLRDLEHTRPGMRGSPNRRVYPSCNQNPDRQQVTLGTSVGWSDVYPHSYYQNFIELDKVPARGCYAYVHIADPKNGIFEKDESNNEASTVVFLTKGGRWIPGRCKGVRDRALPLSQTTDDSAAEGPGGPYRSPF